MANEKRLVDAEAIARKLKNANCAECNVVRKIQCSACWVEDVLELLECASEEVVHGYWIDSYSADHMGRITEHSIDCSVCDSVFKDDNREVVQHWKEQFKVCPFCGAKMDGDGNG